MYIFVSESVHVVLQYVRQKPIDAKNGTRKFFSCKLSSLVAGGCHCCHIQKVNAPNEQRSAFISGCTFSFFLHTVSFHAPSSLHFLASAANGSYELRICKQLIVCLFTINVESNISCAFVHNREAVNYIIVCAWCT